MVTNKITFPDDRPATENTLFMQCQCHCTNCGYHGNITLCNPIVQSRDIFPEPCDASKVDASEYEDKVNRINWPWLCAICGNPLYTSIDKLVYKHSLQQLMWLRTQQQPCIIMSIQNHGLSIRYKSLQDTDLKKYVIGECSIYDVTTIPESCRIYGLLSGWDIR